MKKLIFSKASSMAKMALTLVLGLICVGAANAVETVNLGQIELGKSYPVSAYTSVEAYFVAPRTGTVYMAIADCGVYTDASHTSLVDTEWVNGTFSPRRVTMEAVEGTTYYIYNPFVMDSFELKIEAMEETPLQIIRMSPDNGGVINLNTESTVELLFNQDVEYTGCTLSCGSVTRSADVYVLGSQLNVDISAIKESVKNGTVEAGSKLTVTFEGLKAKNSGALYQGQPTASFDYIVSSIGVVLTSEKVPTVFRSYWPAGDEEGKIVLTFSENLGNGAKCDLVYGNTEGEIGVDLYVETLDASVNGNALTVDLTGKRRSNSDMITSGPFGSMLINVYNITDSKGFAVASEGQGTVGSYSYYIDYQDAQRGDVYYESEPLNGGSLKGKTSMGMWIHGLNTVSFDGFKIEYTDAAGAPAEVVVPMSAVTKDEISADGNEANFTFAIPQAAQNQKNYKVYPNNLQSADGFDYTVDLTAQFDAFVLINVSPANGSSLAALNEGDIISVTPNQLDVYPQMYIVYEIVDLNAENPDEAIVKSLSWLNAQENGTYTAEIPQTVKMIVGHTYRCTFTAYEDEMAFNYGMAPIGTASVEWFGATAPFRYSDIELVSITPAQGTELTAADRVFRLEFTGIVNLPSDDCFINLGNGMTYPFESLTPVDAEDGLSYIWEAVIGESFMSNLQTDLYLTFKAYDNDGRLVKGNEGYEEQSHFVFNYEVSSAFKEFELFTDAYAEGYEIAPSVSSFIAYSELGITPSYNVPFSDAVVMNMGREVVATVVDIIPVYDEEDFSKPVTECHLILDNTIDEAGYYTVSIPRGMFNIGSEFQAWKSAENVLSFEVSGSGLKAVATPAEGQVTSLSTITVEFGSGVMPTGMAGAPTLYKTSREGEAAVEITDITYNSTEENPWATEMVLTLPAEITEPGGYALIIPEGYFYVAPSYNYSNQLTFNYEVVSHLSDPTADWVITPAQGTVESLSEIDIVFSNYPMAGGGSGRATLSINGGEAVNLPDSDFGMEWNEMIQPLGQVYTDNGQYVISFPEGYFNLGETGEPSPAFTLTYQIGGGVIGDPTADWVITPAQGAVESLSEIDIIFSNYPMAGGGSGHATLSIDGGEPVNLPDADFGMEWNEMIQPLGQVYTGAGQYVISFPEGYFNLGETGEPSPAFTLTYQIGSSGIGAICADANGLYVVYSVTGIKVLETGDIADVKALARGIYIVNGVKLMVR